MTTPEIVTAQFKAALKMLRGAVDACPDELWASNAFTNRYWHLAYHALFYTDFYSSPSAEHFRPWALHRQFQNFLGQTPPPDSHPVEVGEPYPKQTILDYLTEIEDRFEAKLTGINWEAPSGFPWLPMNKLELQFYNLRHLQHHTGQLIERLRRETGNGVGWVGRVV